MKSWSNLKINDSFRIYSSWAFWNTPNMSDLSDYWMRYSKFKYNQIFASDFSQRLSSCVLNMPSNENLKASICSLVTPLSSHVIKFIVHSIILIWQAMFSCPAWFWLYCIRTTLTSGRITLTILSLLVSLARVHHIISAVSHFTLVLFTSRII